MISTSLFALHVHASVNRRSSSSPEFSLLEPPFATAVSAAAPTQKHFPLRKDVGKQISNGGQRILDSFVDFVFRFEDQPTLPSQSNFAPVDEIGEAVQIECIEGEIPVDFPEGVYIRNGPNPLFGALKSTVSLFGRSSNTWIEGDGMLHAVYFDKDYRGNWRVSYKNKYVESDTFKTEKQRNKPCFLPAIEGDSPAILVAYLLNMLRFGKVNKDISNTNVFEHAGKYYAIAENHAPQQIDITSLRTISDWNVNGAWDRPFTSHPKRSPGTGELVIMGVDAKKPFFVLGVISADGKKLVHKVDLKFNRSSLCHDIGVTEKYNIIVDCPLTIDIERLIKGGSLIKYEKEGYARIGVMPRYGCADSVKWFEVEPNSTFHVFNCFEDEDEVIVRGCRARGSIIPGPDHGRNKFEWFSRGFKPIPADDNNGDSSCQDGLFFSRAYEWRLNMKTGEVLERNLTGTDFSMDFPMINNEYTGLKNKYGYSQVVDAPSSSSCGLPKYGRVAKLHFEELDRTTKRERSSRELVKVEHHMLEENQFCSGAAFVAKDGGMAEDHGYIISFVHNEATNVSQVHIIDAKNFTGKSVAKLRLRQRVPYGFHSTYIHKAN